MIDDNTLNKIMLADFIEETGLTCKEIDDISRRIRYAEKENSEKETKVYIEKT